MIRLENLTKHFEVPGKQPIIAANNVNMEVPQGEICIFLGPSGCGKTTALKMVNKLIPKTSGKIYIDGQDTDLLNPIELRRKIGYVIQQIGLFPNMTIEENICVVPDLLKMDKKTSRNKAKELLEMVNLDPSIFLKRYPRELSGGQQQRVGVVRALAADPPVMLMDEPFGAIDPINREVIQDEFLKMNAELGKTVLFVSHDIDEAIKMGNKIAIFRDGILEQFDSPDEILANPKNRFVKEFVGSDRALKRLKLINVSEAILPFDTAVNADTPVKKACELMEKNDTAIAVMVGPNGRARGYISHETAVSATGIVGDHHYPVPGTVNIADSLREAASLMYSHGTDWLPVVDDDGFYHGYITQYSMASLLGDTPRKKDDTI
ncbi:ABC transporter ATP-binding protein [Ostreibacterium oceani]|uniref:Quaternary amine transport ATP-binding protein n=1 Tax=Ostreibacterium oceani TaxID=2654998 RepID=A0A6N7F3X1_9GAMM|nr:betaine/proline/choline family ABC transporter ATP-binding protein [Ostreibacterium oceani]MPV86576.1 betaine/proline/choline family ABC transporter ATP-binding protein [Ostreibacterium oceani]